MRWPTGTTAVLALLAACDSQPAAPTSVPFASSIKTVWIEAASTSLAPGEFVQLSAHAYDAEGSEVGYTRFSWSSSNNDIATVDNGLVHALVPGSVMIRAVAEGKSGTVAIGVRVLPPNISELLPAPLAAGQPVVLRVIGTGFYRGSVARLNGVGKPTTFVTASVLKMTLTAADIAEPGSYIVTVFNSYPGAGGSNPVILEVR